MKSQIRREIAKASTPYVLALKKTGHQAMTKDIAYMTVLNNIYNYPISNALKFKYAMCEGNVIQANDAFYKAARNKELTLKDFTNAFECASENGHTKFFKYLNTYLIELDKQGYFPYESSRVRLTEKIIAMYNDQAYSM